MRWVPSRVIELQGYEDEVVMSYVEEMLKGTDICPRILQKNLTGFLNENAPKLAAEIWDLMLEAQTQPDGVPVSLKQAEREADEEPITEEALKERLKAFSTEIKERVGDEHLASPSPERGEMDVLLTHV